MFIIFYVKGAFFNKEYSGFSSNLVSVWLRKNTTWILKNFFLIFEVFLKKL